LHAVDREGERYESSMGRPRVMHARMAASVTPLAIAVACANGHDAATPRRQSWTPGGRNPDAERVVTDCLGAAKAGFEIRTPDASRRALATCARIYLEPGCRRSLAETTDPFQIAGHVSEACREAYCPILPLPPPGCFLPGKLDLMQSALLDANIRVFELGGERAQRLQLGLLELFHDDSARSVAPQPHPKPRCDAKRDGVLSIEVRGDGVWVGSTRGERRFVARCQGEIDGAGVAASLEAVARDAFAGRTDVEVAAVGGLSYQDLITAMDFAIKAGFPDVGLTEPDSLTVRFPLQPRDADRVAAWCGQPAPLRADSSPSPCTSGDSSKPQLTHDDLARTPIVVITQTEITIAGGRITTPEMLASGDRRAAEALAKAMQAAAPVQSGFVIVQGDAGTDTAIINAVVRAAKDAGCSPLFAVKNR
jgi:hypothetical protein